MEKTITIHLTTHKDLPRNNSLGDYFSDEEGNVTIIAYMKNEEYYNEAFLIALHEMIEQRLTEHRGISEHDIDAFDRCVDQNRDVQEPGDEPDAPYYQEHRFAENVERLVAMELGVDWHDYFNNYL